MQTHKYIDSKAQGTQARFYIAAVFARDQSTSPTRQKRDRLKHLEGHPGPAHPLLRPWPGLRGSCNLRAALWHSFSFLLLCGLQATTIAHPTPLPSQAYPCWRQDAGRPRATNLGHNTCTKHPCQSKPRGLIGNGSSHCCMVVPWVEVLKCSEHFFNVRAATTQSSKLRRCPHSNMTPETPMASGPEDEEDVPGVARRAEGGELSIWQ